MWEILCWSHSCNYGIQLDTLGSERSEVTWTPSDFRTQPDANLHPKTSGGKEMAWLFKIAPSNTFDTTTIKFTWICSTSSIHNAFALAVIVMVWDSEVVVLEVHFLSFLSPSCILRYNLMVNGGVVVTSDVTAKSIYPLYFIVCCVCFIVFDVHIMSVSVPDSMANLPFSVPVVHWVLAENNNKSKIIIQPKTIGF